MTKPLEMTHHTLAEMLANQRIDQLDRQLQEHHDSERGGASFRYGYLLGVIEHWLRDGHLSHLAVDTVIDRLDSDKRFNG